MQQRVDERRAPAVADHLWTEDHVAELTRWPGRELVRTVDRKGERIRRLVHSEVLTFQRADLLRPDQGQTELAVVDSLRGEHRARELGRCVPVSSACSLYASTIRCTSLCRTTSSWPNCTNAMSSIDSRMSWTWIRPD